MTARAILDKTVLQSERLRKNTIEINRLWKQFGAAIRKERRERRIQLKVFASGLGYTSAMTSMLETGARSWPAGKAQLAVKLLTRPEQWPDAGRAPPCSID